VENSVQEPSQARGDWGQTGAAAFAAFRSLSRVLLARNAGVCGC